VEGDSEKLMATNGWWKLEVTVNGTAAGGLARLLSVVSIFESDKELRDDKSLISVAQAGPPVSQPVGLLSVGPHTGTCPMQEPPRVGTPFRNVPERGRAIQEPREFVCTAPPGNRFPRRSGVFCVATAIDTPKNPT
jgi:hypothetical protein